MKAGTDPPFVSIIIPVFNDARRLGRCLDMLQQQRYPKERFEVIVVDNGSTDDLAASVCERDWVKVLSESRPSQYAARNTGVAAARGEILAFIDSPCLADPGWIETGVASLIESPNKIAAGRIELFPRDKNAPTSIELYEMWALGFEQQTYVSKYRFGATGNLFLHRKTFDAIGGFDEITKSCGDVEFGQRAHALGYEVVYVDELVVRRPARRTLKNIYTKTVRMIGGMYELKKRNKCSFPVLDISFMQTLLPPVNYALSLLRTCSDRTLLEQFRIIAVMFFVRYVSAFEKMRLSMGGTPQRR